jgi:hypothetical protein
VEKKIKIKRKKFLFSFEVRQWTISSYAPLGYTDFSGDLGGFSLDTQVKSLENSALLNAKKPPNTSYDKRLTSLVEISVFRIKSFLFIDLLFYFHSLFYFLTFNFWDNKQIYY